MKKRSKVHMAIAIFGIVGFCLAEMFQRSIETNISNKPLLFRFFLGEFTYIKGDIIISLLTLIQLFSATAMIISVMGLFEKREK